jgi:hypothetical protein
MIMAMLVAVMRGVGVNMVMLFMVNGVGLDIKQGIAVFRRSGAGLPWLKRPH